MRWIGGAGLVVGFLALYLGIVDAYPVWGFGVACVPFAAILILALQLDSKEKKVGLVCSNCGLRLSGTGPRQARRRPQRHILAWRNAL